MALMLFVLVVAVSSAKIGSPRDLLDRNTIHDEDHAIPVPTGRFCHFYNYTDPCDANGSCTNRTEECKRSPLEPEAACYILWESKQVVNDPSLPPSPSTPPSAPMIRFKGCWLGNPSDCNDAKQCIEMRKNAKRDLFWCCCLGDHCNDVFVHNPVIDNKPFEANGIQRVEVNQENKSVHWLLLVMLTLVGVGALVSVAWFCRLRKNFNPLPTEDMAIDGANLPPEIPFGPIHSFKEKAKGRYGSVYRAKVGENEGNYVAVKIFPPQDRCSWQQEVEIYQLPQMKHENILSFLGAERRPETATSNPEYWLVTEYHELGSLHDYLKANVVSYQELLKISEGISSGLTHLHEELPKSMVRNEGVKPTVAHRDFKSKNVLLKPDLTACIADFGLALVFYPNEAPNETLGQVGTRRYMAPEVLEGAISFSKDALLRIDMYACGLVLWELVSRCSAQDGPVGDYRLPFEEEIGTHPSLEDVQEVVCQKKQRPEIKQLWRNHSGLEVICDTIEELWDQDAEARLSAACVEERITALTNGGNYFAHFLSRAADNSIDPTCLLVNSATPPSMSPSQQQLITIQTAAQQQQSLQQATSV